jgi:hypothetical protein
MSRTLDTHGSDWMGLGMDGWQLMQDAAAVMWLRGMRIAQGGTPAATEAQRMVTEKLEANAAFLMDLATGAAGTSSQAVTSRALAFYGGKVRENRRRLTR